jgi:transposase
MGVNRTSIYLWAKEVKRSGIDNLSNRAKHKEGLKLKNIHKEAIRAWLLAESNLTIIEIKDRLKQKFSLDVSRSTVHRAMRSSGFSYITGRNQHYKQDASIVEILKNKLPKMVKPEEELWCFDESRFGTHSKISHACY